MAQDQNDDKKNLLNDNNEIDIDDFLLDSQKVNLQQKKIKQKASTSIRGITTNHPKVSRKKIMYILFIVLAGYGVIYLFSPEKSYIEDSSFDEIDFVDKANSNVKRKDVDKKDVQIKKIPLKRPPRRRTRGVKRSSENSTFADRIKERKRYREERARENDYNSRSNRDEEPVVEEKREPVQRFRRRRSSISEGRDTYRDREDNRELQPEEQAEDYDEPPATDFDRDGDYDENSELDDEIIEDEAEGEGEAIEEEPFL